MNRFGLRKRKGERIFSHLRPIFKADSRDYLHYRTFKRESWRSVNIFSNKTGLGIDYTVDQQYNARIELLMGARPIWGKANKAVTLCARAEAERKSRCY